MKRRGFLYLTALLLVSALLLCSCTYLLPREEEELAPPLVEPEEITYNTAEVKRTTFRNQINNTAYYSATVSTNISIPYDNGVIVEKMVKQGDVVKAGDLIMNLNSSEMEYKMKIAEIEYEKAKIQYNQSRSMGDYDSRRLAKLSFEVSELTYQETLEKYNAGRVVSPIDGVVYYINAKNIGEKVNANETLATVSQPESAMLVFDGSSALKAFKVGMMVEVKHAEKTCAGQIVSAPESVTADIAKTNIYVLVSENAKGDFNIGDSAMVVTTLYVQKNAIVVPLSALRTFQGRTYVYVMQDGVKVEKDVEVGDRSQTQALILTGLDEGEMLITK